MFFENLTGPEKKEKNCGAFLATKMLEHLQPWKLVGLFFWTLPGPKFSDISVYLKDKKHFWPQKMRTWRPHKIRDAKFVYTAKIEHSGPFWLDIWSQFLNLSYEKRENRKKKKRNTKLDWTWLDNSWKLRTPQWPIVARGVSTHDVGASRTWREKCPLTLPGEVSRSDPWKNVT